MNITIIITLKISSLIKLIFFNNKLIKNKKNINKVIFK